ncbi:probable jasmonic acid carboxyl methyltransferase 1 [Aristolochia californica]|uniref:probable jasmonic acid carboxyl methyltransferase 1 n=1 Tax=Aristolochia californica TaxID=171875 RepID=UPI0035E18530
MKVDQVLRMAGGAGESSYAKNSEIQRTVIEKVKSIIEESVWGLESKFMQSVGIAELGCSSGPNALLATSEIIQAIHRKTHQHGHPLPEFRVFFNDLAGNDFNSVFLSLSGFKEELKMKTGGSLGQCFFAGVPGSFYGRLFPSKSLHFVHSSSSLHWLSQVPEGLENEEGIPINKGDIYVGKSSPPGVFESYLKQFQKDFSSFLRSRSEEIVPGGRMVLTLPGRRNGELAWSLWAELSDALNEMVSEGHIEEAKADAFNLPFHAPSVDELEGVIDMEGSFQLNRAETNLTKLVAKEGDPKEIASQFVTSMRAVIETMLGSYFGEAVLDDLFQRMKQKVAENLVKEDLEMVFVTVSLTRRE